MRPILAITLAMLLTPGMAAAATARAQFDLVCTGASTHIDAIAAPAFVIDKGTLTMRLSVDLKAHRWCYRDTGCGHQFPIAAVDGAKLHLLAVKTDLNEARFDVDRDTGDYNRVLYTPQYSEPMTSTGSCIVAPFTPFTPFK